MPTIMGFKRRGYSAKAINSFCRTVGVTTNTTVFIDYEVLEQHCREDMEVYCKRAMCVLDPIKVIIDNVADDFCLEVERPNHPMNPEMGTNKVHIRKNYWGLAPNKTVGLRYVGNIVCTNAEKDENGKVICLHATLDLEKKEKPKGHIHWVSSGANNAIPTIVEIRLYNHLFTIPKPETGDWEKLINPESLVITKGYVDESLNSSKPGDRFQFERVGFFCVDYDSTEEHLVFNRTVSLKESKEKKSI
ncbi:Glutamine--tRNA ligase [Entamoeba marina]